MTGHYALGGKGGTPAGLAFDAKNHILFVCCRNPATAVILNADDGKIITAVPLGAGTDGASVRPEYDGSLQFRRATAPLPGFMIKETSPTEFARWSRISPRNRGPRPARWTRRPRRILPDHCRVWSAADAAGRARAGSARRTKREGRWPAPDACRIRSRSWPWDVEAVLVSTRRRAEAQRIPPGRDRVQNPSQPCNPSPISAALRLCANLPKIAQLIFSPRFSFSMLVVIAAALTVSPSGTWGWALSKASSAAG